MNYRRPPALVAAELDLYVERYGSSVRALDRAVAEVPSPDGLIDLTHGDTRAFLPPAAARDDLVEAIRDNTEAYSPYRGSVGVRRLLAPRAEGLLGQPVDPATNIVLTPGTQGGLFTALSALVSPGDVVAYPAMEYFMDERICSYLGAVSHRLNLHQGADGTIVVDERDLDAATRAGVRGLVFSHPNNPTGGVYDRDSLERVASWAARHDLWVLVDQLYCRLIFDGRTYTHFASLPEMAERTVTLIGPSKTESMSGYRVGAAVGPADVVDAMEQVISMTSLRTSGYAQHTLGHWMDGDEQWLSDRIDAHQAIRDELVRRLRAISGVEVATPAGSSYVFPDASNTPWAHASGGNDDAELTKELKRRGVLVSPGYQFGLAGRGHFRINFSQDVARLSRATTVIEEVLSGS